MKPRLILASASPRRKELLEQMGAEFEIIPAMGEEVITTSQPREAVLELSRQKAEEVAERFAAEVGAPKLHGDIKKKEDSKERDENNLVPEKTIILGADTVVAFENQILGKPKDKADAIRMLQMLSGNTHSVFTGVTLIICEQGTQEVRSFSEETRVTMYPMTEQEIEAYVATGEPMDKAGAYAIQGKCAIHIEKITGDYPNVVGLPIARIYQELKQSGIEI